MRKRASRDNGIILAYFINLIFQIEWAIISLFCFGLNQWFGAPDILWKIALGIWLIWPAIITFALGALIGNSEPTRKSGENKNPYSATNSTYIKKDNSKDENDN